MLGQPQLERVQQKCTLSIKLTHAEKYMYLGICQFSLNFIPGSFIEPNRAIIYTRFVKFFPNTLNLNQSQIKPKIGHNNITFFFSFAKTSSNQIPLLYTVRVSLRCRHQGSECVNCEKRLFSSNA